MQIYIHTYIPNSHNTIEFIFHATNHVLMKIIGNWKVVILQNYKKMKRRYDSTIKDVIY